MKSPREITEKKQNNDLGKHLHKRTTKRNARTNQRKEWIAKTHIK